MYIPFVHALQKERREKKKIKKTSTFLLHVYEKTAIKSNKFARKLLLSTFKCLILFSISSYLHFINDESLFCFRLHFAIAFFHQCCANIDWYFKQVSKSEQIAACMYIWHTYFFSLFSMIKRSDGIECDGCVCWMFAMFSSVNRILVENQNA